MYAPSPRMPLSRGPSPVPGAQPYYNPNIGRPISRGPSPVPSSVAPQGYYGTPASPYGAPITRPISRGPSPNPYSTSPVAGGFQVEKRAKSPNPYGRPAPAEPVAVAYRDELVYRDQVSALIAAKDRQIAATGRIPVDASQLSLFFRAKDGITYSLDFPVDTGYTTPPALDVLISICKPKPRQMSDYDGYRDREGLAYPLGLPHTTSLEISNYPVLDAIRSSLFPVLPPGQYLTAVRDSLDVAITGSHIAKSYPAHQRQDNRAATLIVTLPVRYRGGAIVISDHDGREERFLGNGGKPTDIEWVAFRSDSAYAIEPVQNGCMITISYAVFIKSFGPTTPTVDTLMTPSDNFFDLLSPILNGSRGRSIAFLLNHDYVVEPAEAVANSIVPQLKGGDALLYDAFKFHKVSPELHWTAGGFIWPVDHTLESFGDEPEANTNPIKNMPAAYGRTPFGAVNAPRGTVPPVRGAFGPYPDPNVSDDDIDGLRAKVQASGGVTLAEANITLLTDAKNPAPSVGRERVYFISNGELEKLVVNVLLVVYIP
ncbi:hypothetical protein JR316_0012952 [Psilocybe cubensis]|uniref:Uncharacterized protein n=2 Tax=Psilocybe cubensis TaxID=181762 RepID=A0ACB8GG18_PSICU|nr:hypothetical protein JR316_0012952 [Psilocybe cubensis]KAH9474493.1 hypothetical protein JR316_0012952 [Psilocybe cubensis]